jgi:hypothetical protein
MKKKLLMTLIVALSPMVVYSAESSKLKTPKEITQAAKSRGATQVVADLFKTGAWAKYVYPGISSGKKQWVDVAVVLKPGTDAGSSEELNDALSLALLRQPDLVLPILKNMWWKDSEACTFGWDSEFPDDMTVRTYVNRLEKTVKKSSNKGTAELRKSCLRGIAKTRKELDENKQ